MIELSNLQEGFKRVLKQLTLLSEEAVTLEFLVEKAEALNKSGVAPGPLNADQLAEVVDSLTLEHAVTFTQGGTVVDPETFREWLQQRKVTTKTPRWDAYKQLLIERDWAEPMIRDLEKQSDEIVELMGDPHASGEWTRKGLLMGEVQSGKTANYIGVLNKALDFGYQVIIVIGGHTNDLRTQTQSRMDSDLLGIDSEFVDDNIARGSIRKIGIGKINAALNAHLMTTVRGDFNSNRSTAGVTWLDSGLPTVFVIKKNAKLIDNVAKYIRTQASKAKISLPLVVIDDEADWGTPNTGSDTDPTRVNKSIRELLDTSTKSTYLGITATPFANIFIDDQAVDAEDGRDLFPCDYIRVLATPSTYFGIGQFFLPHHGGLRLGVQDCLDVIPINHKSDHYVGQLPKSLKEAISTFLVGVAIRRIRSSKKNPSSMLINVSRFNAVQNSVFNLVEQELKGLSDCVRAEFSRSTTEKSDMYLTIKKVWDSEYADCADVTWATVKSVLVDIIDEFRVELVNSKTAKDRALRRKIQTDEQRKEEDLRPTLFVGGDVLSRGLTLEGLQVSYFVREPRTMDTLMQMGRWFGYRPGYMDLIRVWLPEDTAEDFAWCAEVTEELRLMLLEMRSRGLTPKNFGLRIRTHPEGFKIVAANKSRSAQQVIEGPIVWENKLRESFKMESDDDSRARNLRAVENLLDELKRLQNRGAIARLFTAKDTPIWQGVPLEIVQRFFSQFHGHKSNEFGLGLPGRPSVIAEALPEVKGAATWTVSLVKGEVTPPIKIGTSDEEIYVSRRNSLAFDSTQKMVLASNRRVMSAGSLMHAFPRDTNNPPLTQAGALATIENPVLLIAALATDQGFRNALNGTNEQVELSREKPLYAVGVAFPKMEMEEALDAAKKAKKYTGNSVYYRIYMNQFDGDDVEDGTHDSLT